MEYNSMDHKNSFNYEAYEQLLETLTSKEKAGDENATKCITFVKRGLSALHEYVKSVDEGETRIKIAYARYEGEELREIVSAADSARRIAHEAAISHTAVLNRMAESNGIAPLFNGDLDDRLQVADFCLDVTVELFQRRTK